jgi:hypothetical protein
MPPMERIVLVERKHRRERETLGPLFLQGRALGPPNIELFLQMRNYNEMVKRIQSTFILEVI